MIIIYSFYMGGGGGVKISTFTSMRKVAVDTVYKYNIIPKKGI